MAVHGRVNGAATRFARRCPASVCRRRWRRRSVSDGQWRPRGAGAAQSGVSGVVCASALGKSSIGPSGLLSRWNSGSLII